MRFINCLHKSITGSSQIIYPSKPPPTMEGLATVTSLPISTPIAAPAPLLIAVPPVVTQASPTQATTLKNVTSTGPPQILKRANMLKKTTAAQVVPPRLLPQPGPETESRFSASTSANLFSSAAMLVMRGKGKPNPSKEPPRRLPPSRPSEVVLIVPDDSEIKYENENSDEDEAITSENNIPEIKIESEDEEEIKIVKTETKQNKRKQSFQTLKEQLPPVPEVENYHLTNYFQHQTCDLCGKRYRIKDIGRHLKIHVKNYVTKCVNPSCPHQFSCRYKMEDHLKRQNKDERRKGNFCAPKADLKMVCPVDSCGFKIERMDVFQSHLETHEKEIKMKKFTCPIPGCSLIYGLRESVEAHIFFHDLRPPKIHQQCSICKAKVDTEEMERHLMESHAIGEAVACKSCNFVFPPDRLALIEHLWEEHKDYEGASCDICGEDEGAKFTRQDTLREHYSIAHNVGELQSCVCDHCSAELSSEMGLRIHLRLVHPDKADTFPAPKKKKIIRRSYKCDLCPTLTKFRHAKSLFLHKTQVHHKGANRISCKHCGKSFVKNYLLRKHLAMFHGGVARIWKYSRPGCEEKTFKENKNLQYHLKTAHPEPGNEKPFRCDKCVKRYWTQKDLDRHQQIAHEGVRPEMCDTCGERFINATSLRRHNLIHTGERPYPCPICNQPFRQKETLTVHVRSHKEKGDNFKPSGPAKKIRKIVDRSRRKD